MFIDVEMVVEEHLDKSVAHPTYKTPLPLYVTCDCQIKIRICEGNWMAHCNENIVLKMHFIEV